MAIVTATKRYKHHTSLTLRKDASMERNTVLHRATLLIVAASQLWLIYRFEQLAVGSITSLPTSAMMGPVSTEHSAATTAPAADTAAAPMVVSSADLPTVLQRIDTRLAQLERLSDRSASPLPSSQRHEPNARERAEADQRLSHLLPSGPLSREDMARFHADIQALPPDERFAMATALARAINEGRVQPGPEGL